MANSEMLCFEIATRFKGQPCSRLKWVISPSDKQTVEDLRDKIRSKMVVANLLSAFIAAALGFVAANMADRAKIDYLSKQLPAIVVAAVLIFVALVLYLTTMCSYDALLMPTRFWSESASRADDRPTWIVERPPSPISWILYQNMVHVWKWQFIPATYCLIMGLLTLIIATLLAKVLPHTRWSVLITLAGPLVMSASIFLACRTRHQVRAPRPKRPRIFNFGSSWRYSFGPWLGSED
jgi:hypothetical protein